MRNALADVRAHGHRVVEARNFAAYAHLAKAVVIDKRDRGPVVHLRMTRDVNAGLVYAVIRSGGLKARWRGDPMIAVSINR